MLFLEVKDIWRIFALHQNREITGTEQGVVGDVTGSAPFRGRVGFVTPLRRCHRLFSIPPDDRNSWMIFSPSATVQYLFVLPLGPRQ